MEKEEIITSFIMPSNPADRKDILDVVAEISSSMTRSAAERDYQKDALKDLSKKYQIPTKLLKRFASSYHKQNYTEELGQNSDYETLVEILLKT